MWVCWELNFTSLWSMSISYGVVTACTISGSGKPAGCEKVCAVCEWTGRRCWFDSWCETWSAASEGRHLNWLIYSRDLVNAFLKLEDHVQVAKLLNDVKWSVLPNPFASASLPWKLMMFWNHCIITIRSFSQPWGCGFDSCYQPKKKSTTVIKKLDKIKN